MTVAFSKKPAAAKIVKPDSEPPSAEQPAPPPKLAELLDDAFSRVARRNDGHEKPIALPWATLNGHFGGGLWPGVHFIVKGTGVGGTQLTLQTTLHAAHKGVPCLYVGLEMSAFDISVRAMGLESGVPWSALWMGSAGTAYMKRAKDSIAALSALPLHIEVARPMGYTAADIVSAVERVRALYPGESPILVVVDFLQLIGNDPTQHVDLRQRIANGSYALRDVAVRFNAAVLAISSIARLTGRGLSELVAGVVSYREDEHGRPIDRVILEPDQIVGLGKESGEIEYSGDSVSVIARVAGSYDGHGCDVIFATAKGRATGATWSPLRFTGHAYEEPEDLGGRIVDRWKEVAEKRATAKAERVAQKEQAKTDKVALDAAAIARFVLANPGCNVTRARKAVVANNARRWTPAVELLDTALERREGASECALSIAADLLPEEVRRCL